MSTGKIISGVVAGLAAGAVLGILFAPDKGTETRRKISRGGTDLKDSLKSKFNGMVNDVVDEYEQVKEKASNLFSQGKEKVAVVANSGKEKAELWKQDEGNNHNHS